MREILEEYSKKIEEDKVIRILSAEAKRLKVCSSLKLTGGAIVDILDGRTPKDYDFIVRESGELYQKLLKYLAAAPSWEFLYNTSTSYTFKFKGEYIVQFLTTDTSLFQFEIERGIYCIKNSKLETFDHIGYKRKTLIVNKEVTQERSQFKKRIRHWSKKRYTLPEQSRASQMRRYKRFSFRRLLHNNVES